MPTANRSGAVMNRQANSAPAIEARLSSKQISWTGPLILTVGRSVLVLGAQALVSLVFLLQRDPAPFILAQWPMDIVVALMSTGVLH